MSKEFKEFDFEEAGKVHSPEKVAWLKENCKKKVSEKKFVKEMKELKQFSLAKRCRSRKYSPSRLKNQYKRLKKNFGFFK